MRVKRVRTVSALKNIKKPLYGVWKFSGRIAQNATAKETGNGRQEIRNLMVWQ